MAPEARQLLVADALHVGRPGLGELTGDPPDLHHGHAEGVGEHHGGLQDHPQLVADVVGRELLEALGAVPGLEQEGIPGGDPPERSEQVPGLAGEDEGRIARDLLQGPIDGGLIGPDRLLLDGEVPP